MSHVMCGACHQLSCAIRLEVYGVFGSIHNQMNDRSYRWRWTLDAPYYFDIDEEDFVSNQIVGWYCTIIYTKKGVLCKVL